jgi:hypothetical protein
VLGNEPRHASGLRTSDTGQPAGVTHARLNLRLTRASPCEDCSAFTRLRPAHSRGHLYVTCYTEGFSHFVSSMTAPVASGWSGCRVGLHPLEGAALSRRTREADIPDRGTGRLSRAEGEPTGVASVSCETNKLHQQSPDGGQADEALTPDDSAAQFARIVSTRWPTIKFMRVWDTVASVIVPRADRFYILRLEELRHRRSQIASMAVGDHPALCKVGCFLRRKVVNRNGSGG